MATIRDLKNDVNYLTVEVIYDCETVMNLHSAKRDDALVLIEEAVELRNNLIAKINHPEETTKAYFKAIKSDLIAGADAIFEKLRKLIA